MTIHFRVNNRNSSVKAMSTFQIRDLYVQVQVYVQFKNYESVEDPLQINVYVHVQLQVVALESSVLDPDPH